MLYIGTDGFCTFRNVEVNQRFLKLRSLLIFVICLRAENGSWPVLEGALFATTERVSIQL
jgi:hypothetical protein